MRLEEVEEEVVWWSYVQAEYFTPFSFKVQPERGRAQSCDRWGRRHHVQATWAALCMA